MQDIQGSAVCLAGDNKLVELKGSYKLVGNSMDFDFGMAALPH